MPVVLSQWNMRLRSEEGTFLNHQGQSRKLRGTLRRDRYQRVQRFDARVVHSVTLSIFSAPENPVKAGSGNLKDAGCLHLIPTGILEHFPDEL